MVRESPGQRSRRAIVELVQQIGSRKEVELYLKHYSGIDSRKFAVIQVRLLGVARARVTLIPRRHVRWAAPSSRTILRRWSSLSPSSTRSPSAEQQLRHAMTVALAGRPHAHRHPRRRPPAQRRAQGRRHLSAV
jgi:hypothetical protein